MAQEPGCGGSGWTSAEVSGQPALLPGARHDGEGWQALPPLPGIASPAPQPPLPGGSGPRGAGCLWGPSRCCEVLTGCNWRFVVTWKKGERGMSWSRERGRARAGEGCRRKAEGEALVTVDVEAVPVQAVGAQARDASGLVAHFVVKAHPVQAWGGGLLCVGADGVHACVVPLPHWPGKQKAVPERPFLCPVAARSGLGAPAATSLWGMRVLYSAVRNAWPALPLLPPLKVWRLSGSTGQGQALESFSGLRCDPQVRGRAARGGPEGGGQQGDGPGCILLAVRAEA